MTDPKDIHLYQNRPDVKASSILNLEVTVDSAVPQPLNKLRSFPRMISQIPVGLQPEAEIIVSLLFSCFEKAGHVSEGLIGDLIWGFAQLTPDDKSFIGRSPGRMKTVPPELTLAGLSQLAASGYIKFQAPDNSFVDLSSDQAGKAWVRYQQKLLDMVYER